MATEFHDHLLSPTTQNAFHALAIDENRSSYEPLPWKTNSSDNTVVEQAWFPGAHADIGGHISKAHKSRTLSNIPFVWMLERAEACGLALPDMWKSEFPCDVSAPMHGPYRGSARLFIDRKPREVGLCSSEYIHDSVFQRQQKLPRYRPRAIVRADQKEMETRARERALAIQQKPKVHVAKAEHADSTKQLSGSGTSPLLSVQRYVHRLTRPSS